MNSSSSLRDLYSDPSSAWSFTQASPAPAAASGSSSTPGPSTIPFQWKSRSGASHNSIFDLSPDLNDVSVSDIDLIRVLKTVLASAMLQYTSTAIAMPWEVGKLLLQVQWVPRDVQDSDLVQEVAEEEETSDSDEDDSYFADPEATSTTSREIPRNDHAPIRDEGSRPEYIIPVGPQDGVWGMMKRIGRFRSEGWLALWKGLLTSCATEVLASTLQPIINNILQSLFFPSNTLFHQPPILLPVASHLITGFILSPLDLIRTRMIVQSFIPRYKSYSGLKGIYLHPNLLFPTIIDCAFRPLVSLALPGIIASYVGARITEENNPIAWGIAELAGSCIGLLLTLPFETVRRRLQVQTRGTAKPINGCVELRPKPYYGVVDTLWHIITEERSDVPLNRHAKKRRASRASAGSDHSILHTRRRMTTKASLRIQASVNYIVVLGMRLGASVIVFILAVVSGGEDSDSGWAEL
ncbi:mitochondrial carrier [Gymnopus androsaceus JB14]|uniref:Mitochondrial carrier n=1 Tax=Gymnopus androsaceus JB14 TaxID=1447944 RepID=A0A6A4HE58_9AGAR|nr:mitochondrial carrier [Gymnopus androsaceus JB14]